VAAAQRRQGDGERHSTDPLLALEPRAYVEGLTGLSVNRDAKVNCPLHEDRTPSLHVYAGAGGWFCFGCERGGSIYDLAAELWRLDTHGEDFLELRRRLHAELGVDTPARSRP
jgi:hypothetical protein